MWAALQFVTRTAFRYCLDFFCGILNFKGTSPYTVREIVGSR